MATQTWIRNEDDYAVVAPADAAGWESQGWTASDPPPPDGWVHIWHDGIEGSGRVPALTVSGTWAHLGWVAGPPPGGPHPFAPKPAAGPAATKSSKSAPSGEVKEKPGA